MRYNGKPLLLDINNTFRQSFSVDYDAAIFMDRDGVINECFINNGKPIAPLSLKELKILPGVEESVLKIKGFNGR